MTIKPEKVIETSADFCSLTGSKVGAFLNHLFSNSFTWIISILIALLFSISFFFGNFIKGLVQGKSNG